ncbi:hypothetical protein [Legionella tunisiensis]|uniref:hypothetical protein n=1 Tax=Legionella tunisiensis TaxID=1034944 RepID=UPI000380A420|nr:hypothetical protein [Legionella tunisiensis]
MADPITDIESLKHYIGQLCYNKLGSDDKATTEIVVAVNRDTFMNAQELDKLLEDAIKIGFDPDETVVEDEVREEKLKAIDKRVAAIVSRVALGIEQQRAIPKDKHSTAERLVNDYFFLPYIRKEQPLLSCMIQYSKNWMKILKMPNY